jgi:hypothetical protein
VTNRAGIPLTTPARTLRDLKRTAACDLYLRAARRAIDLRLAEPAGTATDERTRSDLERRFLALVGDTAFRRRKSTHAWADMRSTSSGATGR